MSGPTPYPGGAATPEAEKRIAYLERKIQRLQESQLRREKLDDVNRHLLNNALTELESAREKSEAASRAKTEFLANMSHEIRTPLNIIMGLGELLDETALNARQRQFVGNLRVAGRHLLEIIDSILEFSRIEKGDVDLEIRPFNLRQLIQDLCEMMETLTQRKGLAFRVVWNGEVGEIFRGDKGKLRQVLVNLVNNAVKFTEKGEVCLTIGVDEVCGGLVFRVADTGIGVSEREREAIFERFSQSRTALARRQGGVGLGLAIVRILVGAMDGTIEMESSVGQGTVFTVHLPLDAETADRDGPLEREGTSPPDLSDIRLLVVDDVAGNREVVQFYLDGYGAQTAYAESGGAAIELCMRQRFDTILLDISMPGMDGISAIREIREIERQKGGRPVRIVAMTAHAFQEIQESLLHEGFDGILTKPFSRADLLAVLAEECDGLTVGRANSYEVSAADASWQDVDVPASLVTLIPKFLEIMLCEHEKMGELLRAGQFRMLSDLSHANKGVAGMYGFMPLMGLLAEFEQSARQQSWEQGSQIWTDIGRMLADLADTCPVSDT